MCFVTLSSEFFCFFTHNDLKKRKIWCFFEMHFGKNLDSISIKMYNNTDKKVSYECIF